MIINTVLEVFTVAITGLVLGSFMNVLVYRIPRGQSIVKPGSHCTKCNSAIAWYDNIPVLSWLILKGQCRYCDKPIGTFYPLVEITTCIVFTILYFQFGLTEWFVKYAVMCYIILCTAFTDIDTAMDNSFETGVIPVAYVVIGSIAGLIFSFYEGNFINSLAGWGAGYLVLFIPAYLYSVASGRDGMGDGDFLLFAMIGSFTGVGSIPAILTISASFGVFVGVIVIYITGNKKYPLPFAPMLGVGGIVYVFFESVLKVSF